MDSYTCTITLKLLVEDHVVDMQINIGLNQQEQKYWRILIWRMVNLVGCG